MTNSQTASQSRWPARRPTCAEVPVPYQCHNILLLCLLHHHILFRLYIISAVLSLLSCVCSKFVIVILTVLNKQIYSFICCNFLLRFILLNSVNTLYKFRQIMCFYSINCEAFQPHHKHLSDTQNKKLTVQQEKSVVKLLKINSFLIVLNMYLKFQKSK